MQMALMLRHDPPRVRNGSSSEWAMQCTNKVGNQKFKVLVFTCVKYATIKCHVFQVTLYTYSVKLPFKGSSGFV